MKNKIVDKIALRMLDCSGRASTKISNNHAVLIYAADTTKWFDSGLDRFAEKFFYMRYVVGMTVYNILWDIYFKGQRSKMT